MGSLHCAGMCGPLVLMTPVVGHTRASHIASRATYHLGRVATYAVIGLIFGLVGESIIFAGLQRWLSFVVGVLMLLALFASFSFKAQLTRIPFAIKSIFAKFIHQRTFVSIFALGATNGLLPCGLVYLAATASIAAGSIASAAAYMLLFGLGTLPMLLTISFAGQRLNLRRYPFLPKLAPIGAAAVAVLLIVRAQPQTLLSPQAKVTCPACRTSN